jgi:predicted NUDIX family phosphoesterase
MAKKHPQHIVCIKASQVAHSNGKTVDYKLNAADLMLGQRNRLEHDFDFRQVLAVAIFMHEGKIWAYRRATSGGENRLHGKLAIAVGGHWDAEDVVWDGSVVDVGASTQVALQRELDEEIDVQANILNSHVLDEVICANATEVDRLHIAQVSVYEIDAAAVKSKEDQLDPVGFLTPDEILARDDCETWTTIIAEIVKKQQG